MSLRARIAAAGSLAVAVTVVLAAVIVYLAVRAELRGNIDDALRQTAGRMLQSERAPAAGTGLRRGCPFDRGSIPAPAGALRRRARLRAAA